MKDSVPLTIRLQEVERVLLAHSDGLTRSQIASLLGVHRSTISRAVSRLTEHLPIHETDGKLMLDHEKYEASIRFTTRELLALYRRGSLTTQNIEPVSEHVLSALQKLAQVIGNEISPDDADTDGDSPNGTASDGATSADGSATSQLGLFSMFRRTKKTAPTPASSAMNVKIQFGLRVARRIKEIRWHWNQRVEEMKDGTVMWYATIDMSDEILPWIRSWGQDAIVLEPPELRALITQELRLALKHYD